MISSRIHTFRTYGLWDIRIEDPLEDWHAPLIEIYASSMILRVLRLQLPRKIKLYIRLCFLPRERVLITNKVPRRTGVKIGHRQTKARAGWTTLKGLELPSTLLFQQDCCWKWDCLQKEPSH
jgi:hypothetical protein